MQHVHIYYIDVCLGASIDTSKVTGSHAPLCLQVRHVLPTLSWDAPRPIDADKVEVVRAALKADQGKTPVATDPYFFGKQVGLAPPWNSQ